MFAFEIGAEKHICRKILDSALSRPQTWDQDAGGAREGKGGGEGRGGSRVGESARGVECWERVAERSKEPGVEPGPGFTLQLDLD